MAARKLLFICSQNKLRSPTAETIFSDTPGIEVDSAGLNHDAIVPLSPEQLRWADLILVMESTHRNRLARHHSASLKGKRVVVLGIPDDYDYMDEELVRILKVKCARYLP
ncbi:MAG: low molecular weight protein tyrosine phosphatase family protein [Akkermansiaceae bacterium]|nr:low molecular weight protein tyrosine phosphatase family protein [Akkermansiaceae bacterium]